MAGWRFAPGCTLALALASIFGCAPSKNLPSDLSGQWNACAWQPSEQDRNAECTVVELPLDHDAKTKSTLRIAVKRRFIGPKPVQAQVWLVHGGPGSSAVDEMDQLAFGLPESRSRFELLAADHRGVGRLGKITCRAADAALEKPGQLGEIDWQACVNQAQTDHAGRLQFLTTTDSAKDLGILVERYRRPGVPIYIFGVSYGTYLIQRYLQIYPQQPSGVILHAITNPIVPAFKGYDTRFDQVARQILQACRDDSSCAERFGGRDPVLVAEAAVASLSTGRCSSLESDADRMREFLASILFRRPLQEMVPALVFRLDRCEPHDVERLRHFLEFVADRLPTSEGESTLLGVHVALSELFESNQPLNPDSSGALTLIASPGTEAVFKKIAPIWPRYERDDLHGQWANYDGPLLMLQGFMDPATPIDRAREVSLHFQGNHQTWVALPYSAHVLLGETPTTDDEDCAHGLYLDFLDDPSAFLDTLCTAKVLPLDFGGNRKLSKLLLGTTDAWEQ